MQINTVNIFAPPVATPEAMALMERLMRGLGRADSTDAPADPAAPVPAMGAVPPAPGEYWPGQGGIYICTAPAQFGLPARHIVIATEEKDGLAYGGYDSDCPGATSQTDGRSNTAALLADSEDHPAAAWAAAYTADGHTDFHLPSRFDLLLCWLIAPHLFNKDGWYASSSQYSRHLAWIQDFQYGYSSDLVKGHEFRVRPLRWIPL